MSSFAKRLLRRKPSLKVQASSAPPSCRDSAPTSGKEVNRKCTLLVVGTESVGKTALVVRFLAKRFLPQYDGEADKTYTRAVAIEEKMLNLKIIDKAGKMLMKTVTQIENLDQVDGLIVVFSCSNSESFDSCLSLLDFFKFDCKSTLQTPTLVIGNKTDLKHLRVVGSTEARKCILKYPGCSFEECSAANSDDNVEVVFRSFIQKTLAEGDTREIEKNGRKSSIAVMGSPKVVRAHFKRRFSMFGRDWNGST